MFGAADGRTPARPPAVVVGLDSITGLQVARILAGHGVPVVGIADDASHFAARTRACRRVVEADTRSPALIEALERLARGFPEPPALIPCHDLAVLHVSRNRERLAPSYRWALPGPEVVETLVDKARFAEFARVEGFPMPRTAIVRDGADVEEVARSLTYPCVLKPGLKGYPWLANVHTKAFKVTGPDELLAIHARVRRWADAFVVQEWIKGGEGEIFGCYAVLDARSEPLAVFVSRKIRQWPPETGSGSLSVGCRDPEVRDLGLEVLQRAGVCGIGHVEMKREAGTGRPLVVEVNLRPSGHSALAEADGVNLHLALYRQAAGLPPRPAGEPLGSGVRWLYLRNDLLAAARARRRGDLTLREWARSLRGPRAWAVWSLRDPVPFLADWGGWVARALRRRLGPPGRGRGSHRGR